MATSHMAPCKGHVVTCRQIKIFRGPTLGDKSWDKRRGLAKWNFMGANQLGHGLGPIIF